MSSNELIIKILDTMLKKDSFKLNMKELHQFGSKKEIDLIIQFLGESQLIRYDSGGEPGYFLAPKGMSYLNEQKSEKIQYEFNIMVAFTGTIIALIGIYNFLKEDFMYHFVNALILKIIFLFLISICVIPLINIIFIYLKNEVFRK